MHGRAALRLCGAVVLASAAGRQMRIGRGSAEGRSGATSTPQTWESRGAFRATGPLRLRRRCAASTLPAGCDLLAAGSGLLSRTDTVSVGVTPSTKRAKQRSGRREGFRIAITWRTAPTWSSQNFERRARNRFDNLSTNPVRSFVDNHYHRPGSHCYGSISTILSKN